MCQAVSYVEICSIFKAMKNKILTSKGEYLESIYILQDRQ